jgi:hypothetical protein
MLPPPKRSLKNNKSKVIILKEKNRALDDGLLESLPHTHERVSNDYFTPFPEPTIEASMHDSGTAASDDDDLFNLSAVNPKKPAFMQIPSDVRMIHATLTNRPPDLTPSCDETRTQGTFNVANEKPKRRKRKPDEFSDLANVKLKEIRQSDQLDLDEEALKLRLIAEENSTSASTSLASATGRAAWLFHKPSKAARASNHVMALAFHSQQNQKSLNEYHAAASATKNDRCFRDACGRMRDNLRVF